MIMNYITKIKANISIFSSKKTTNILEGTYNSIYKGKSSNFEDLRTYVLGDNVKDIDWKASARSSTTLIRQYIAEKKHNIMLVLDTGKKMLADTQSDENKKDVALMSAGTIAYLANKNGDYVGAIYNKENSVSYYPFKTGIYNIEKILSIYDCDVQKTNYSYLENSLEYISKHIKKRMIIFIITDLEGMDRVQENIIKRLATVHDVMFININDANMLGNNVYDIENSIYIPSLILQDNKLHELEKKMKEDMYNKCLKKFEKYRVSVQTIDCNKEIVVKIINLLERHRYASIS
ncbi:MAG: DUF58 domain-containing protein [Clostridia bacterium]|nr:DUF58 domain-containing protein [Clostridia bacterium]